MASRLKLCDEGAFTENVFLGLGSNIGDRHQFLAQVVAALQAHNSIRLIKTSSVYESEPYGLRQQGNFLNMVIQIATSLVPIVLLDQVKAIESQLGRKPAQRWGPREIDIDILCYGQIRINLARLSIPHPELAKRRFVLMPFAEIAPKFVPPEFTQNIEQLLSACPDEGWVHSVFPSLQRCTAVEERQW